MSGGSNKIGSNHNSPLWIDTPEASGTNQVDSPIGKTSDHRDVVKTPGERNLMGSSPEDRKNWKSLFVRNPLKTIKNIYYFIKDHFKNKHKHKDVTDVQAKPFVSVTDQPPVYTSQNKGFDEPPVTFDSFKPPLHSQDNPEPVVTSDDTPPTAKSIDESSLPRDSMNLHMTLLTEGELATKAPQTEPAKGDEEAVDVPESENNQQLDIADTSQPSTSSSPPSYVPPPPPVGYVPPKKALEKSPEEEPSKSPVQGAAQPIALLSGDRSNLMEAIRNAGGAEKAGLKKVEEKPDTLPVPPPEGIGRALGGALDQRQGSINSSIAREESINTVVDGSTDEDWEADEEDFEIRSKQNSLPTQSIQISIKPENNLENGESSVASSSAGNSNTVTTTKMKDENPPTEKSVVGLKKSSSLAEVLKRRDESLHGDEADDEEDDSGFTDDELT